MSFRLYVALPAGFVLLSSVISMTTCHAADDSSAEAPNELVSRAAVTLHRDLTATRRDLGEAQLQRQLQIAQIELRLYERVEYPTLIRRLESEIKLATAERDSAARLLAEYESHHRSRYSNPFLVSIESAQLTMTEAQLRLDDLKKEKCLAKQFHVDRLRLHRLRVEAVEQALGAVAPSRPPRHQLQQREQQRQPQPTQRTVDKRPAAEGRVTGRLSVGRTVADTGLRLDRRPLAVNGE